ncbi:hypothetical protein PVK73_20380 [Bacillus thuringiensis]
MKHIIGVLSTAVITGGLLVPTIDAQTITSQNKVNNSQEMLKVGNTPTALIIK